MPQIKGISNRILLFKPMKDLTYIRKGMNYASFHALGTVSKDNKVMNMALEFGFFLSPFKNLGEYERKVLGKKRCEKANPEDYYSIYAIKTPLKLINPIQLDKPVRGMRFANAEEDYEIRKEILKGLAKHYNISLEDMFWNWGNYPELYKNSWEMDFQNVLFDLEKSGELYNYTKKESKKKKNYDYHLIGDSGQTRMM